MPHCADAALLLHAQIATFDLVVAILAMPIPPPLPCFLEVLILKDFKSFEPELLIPGDFKSLFPEVLILVELNSIGINDMREIENFSEVLIPEGLSGAKCANG